MHNPEIRLDQNLRLGLSLSGGAARGAYQIGFWRALRENGVMEQVKIITGASVGAINGALMVQDDWEKALSLWTETEPADGFDQLRESPGMGYLGLIQDGLKNRGVRVSGLKKLLYEALNEELIQAAGIDFGLVIFNLSQRRGESWYKDEIPRGLLSDYIIGSASFPAFQAHRIGENKYLDGGMYKILPVDLAFKRHELDLLIGIDVAEASRFLPLLWRSKMKYGERLLYLRPSRLLPSPANFSRQARVDQIDIGYEDGLKAVKHWYA
jgi:NTE family protein